MQMKTLRNAFLGGLFVLSTTSSVLSQGTPSPGPTNPTPPPNPQAQPGATIVVNPTADQCRQGWNASMKWTKQQFEDFCHKLRVSK
jgi:hypothetical protein